MLIELNSVEGIRKGSVNLAPYLSASLNTVLSVMDISDSKIEFKDDVTYEYILTLNSDKTFSAEPDRDSLKTAFKNCESAFLDYIKDVIAEYASEELGFNISDDFFGAIAGLVGFSEEEILEQVMNDYIIEQLIDEITFTGTYTDENYVLSLSCSNDEYVSEIDFDYNLFFNNLLLTFEYEYDDTITFLFPLNLTRID